MYQRRPDIVAGNVYGRLTAIKMAEPGKRGQTRWVFQCECGNTITTDAIDVKKGKTKSCRCLCTESFVDRNTKHGMCHTRLYGIYIGMKQRCNNPDNEAYKNYGKRGIKICDEWLRSPFSFFEWALSNGYAENLSIERKDNNGNYEPGNCVWATMPEQSRNKRSNVFITIGGATKILGDWAKEFGVNQWRVAARIRNGWDPIDALREPFHAWNPKRKGAYRNAG